MCTDRFTGVAASTGGVNSYFIAPDLLPRMDSDASFDKRLGILLNTFESLFSASGLAMEVMSDFQRLASSEDLRLVVDNIYEAYDTNLRMSPERATLMYTLPAFGSGRSNINMKIEIEMADTVDPMDVDLPEETVVVYHGTKRNRRNSDESTSPQQDRRKTSRSVAGKKRVGGLVGAVVGGIVAVTGMLQEAM